ncbi:GNAT family N-acetyltransferase [Arcanobacterium pinnipediorum]|uniref:N-acetyltransferase n=1 Tax=Arcanobacterium pinnipediorum TaxID=1503041 RepID=A0ABY5AFU6_9ACTO|nr:GNAT family N-acetyltransferase [Arcanobacterium pinnipediorum]USR78880.1 N-acetyltransferase [Arcanobacterium pinnipediorum]
MTEQLTDKNGQAVEVIEGNSLYAIRYTDSEVAGFAQYVDNGDERIFFHTEVRPELEGRGLAGTLVKVALNETQAANKTIVAMCPMVRRWLGKHGEGLNWRPATMEDQQAVMQSM